MTSPWGPSEIDSHDISRDSTRSSIAIGCFAGTLDGSGVYYLVNYDEVGNPARILKAPVTGKLDRAISARRRILMGRRSPLPYFFAGSLALILILWSFGRLRRKREILFMGTQLPCHSLIDLPERRRPTGAQHVIAFYPFVFILIAYSICEFSRWLGKSQGRRKAFSWAFACCRF